MELQSKEFEIKGNKYYFLPCYIAMIEFEETEGKMLEDSESIREMLYLVYYMVKAGMTDAGLRFDMTKEDFIVLVNKERDLVNELMAYASDTKKKRNVMGQVAEVLTGRK